jgi:hypothetical protein
VLVEIAHVLIKANSLFPPTRKRLAIAQIHR